LARGHWGIENQLHWVLDVAMAEDLSRNRKDHAPQNLALLRRFALKQGEGLQPPQVQARWLKRPLPPPPYR
jgi:hypothetical protein